ncbi:MAG TPA: tail fiber protein [Thermoanaerobaculia bacterium]|nr:tail fiber protein [Thermoanaerobaculia bacterium]
MASPFVAEIRIFACNFAPTGWALCNGQLLPISQNTALFSLLGTFYGGDGKSTFALPNMQGSVPLNQGQGAGLSAYFLGQQSGSESVTLIQSEIPAHSHFWRAASDIADNSLPDPNKVVTLSNNGFAYAPAGTTPAVNFNAQMLSVAGSSFPHNNMQPYLTLNFCIAMQGVFPPRS